MNNKVNSIYSLEFCRNIAPCLILYLIASRYTSASDADILVWLMQLETQAGIQVRNYQATDLKETYSYLAG